jgi:hypothetical protein
MSTIRGRFFFKLTDSKNLIGEFSNNLCKRNFTESADLHERKQEDAEFIGDYFTTWHEEKGHQCVLAKLKIEQKLKSENIFRLSWWRVNNGVAEPKPFFQGEGILCDGILIGDYQDC